MQKEKRLKLLAYFRNRLTRRHGTIMAAAGGRAIKQRGPGVRGSIAGIRQIADPLAAAPGAGWVRQGPAGLWTRRTVNHNIVVLGGLSALARWIQSEHAEQGGYLRYLHVGTGYTTPAKDDTALETPLAYSEIDSWDNTDIASDPVVMIASVMFLTSEANGEIMEAALYSDSNDEMFCRGLFGHGMITGATQADPCVITSVGHGLASTEKIKITGVTGMTDLNDTDYFVDVLTPDTFALYTDVGLSTAVDSTGFDAFTPASPETANWKLIIPKTVAEILTVNYSLTFPAE